MKKLLLPLILISSLGFAASADAHFLWVSVMPGNKLRMELAESPGVSVAPMKVKKPVPGVKPGLTTVNAERFQADSDGIHLVSTLQAGKAAGGGDLVYGVHESSLIHWSAKGITTLTDGSNPIGLPAEITLKHGNRGIAAVVLLHGKPVAGADIEIYVGGSSEEIKLKTDKNGMVTLPALKKGLLAIGAIISVPGSGDFKGTHYNDTKEMASLTVQVS